jgi:hypothetical protein
VVDWLVGRQNELGRIFSGKHRVSLFFRAPICIAGRRNPASKHSINPVICNVIPDYLWLTLTRL